MNKKHEQKQVYNLLDIRLLFESNPVNVATDATD